MASEVFVPDGDEASRWAKEELAKQAYQAAKPNWFDEFIMGIVRWFNDLFDPRAKADGAPIVITLIVVVIVCALVVALLIWGKPRASRSAPRRPDLLGAPDDRTAAQLRTEAERHAKDGDWDTAIILRYRALARAMVERDLITPAPGATAQGIARQASAPFPGLSSKLHEAATSFDAIRYLGESATEGRYRRLANTDDEVARAVPLHAVSQGVSG